MGDPDEAQIAAGLARMEGYLLWQSEVERARRRAVRFADRLPWLAAAQRGIVEGRYVEDQLDASRATIRYVGTRIQEVEQQYRQIYGRLRLRLVMAHAIALALLAGAAAGVCVLTWPGRAS